MHELLVFVTAVMAGGINSVAGGGSLITFPTLIWLGAPAINANATNTVAVWPGTLGSVWGYRRELRGADPRVYALTIPSVIGGAAGALLLYRTPPGVFDRLVPILILFATCLFMAQEPLQRRFNLAAAHAARSHWLSWTMFYQLLVGLYGGYFGSGIGILMLAALSLMGHTDIHQMNGLKNVLATCINAVAAIVFIFSGLVLWSDAAFMAAGTIVGGVGGTMYARRIGRNAVRRLVVAIGFGMALALMLRLSCSAFWVRGSGFVFTVRVLGSMCLVLGSAFGAPAVSRAPSWRSRELLAIAGIQATRLRLGAQFERVCRAGLLILLLCDLGRRHPEDDSELPLTTISPFRQSARNRRD